MPGQPAREPAPRPGWPDWLEWTPNRIWAYDFTHWTRAGVLPIAIIDVVSRKWLATLTGAEESSTQVEVAFTAALQAEGLLELADARGTEALRDALAAGDRQLVHDLADHGPGGRYRAMRRKCRQPRGLIYTHWPAVPPSCEV